MVRQRLAATLLILLAALAVPGAGGAAAGQATPPAPPAAAPALDLAAMTLVPADLAAPGYGLVRGPNSASRTLHEYTDDPELRKTLVAAGWQRFHQTALGIGLATEPPRWAVLIASYVTEYGDAPGAAAGFAVLEDERGQPGVADVAGTTRLGEQSEITRGDGITSDTNLPYQWLDLTFRLDRLVAGVTVYDYSNHAPDVAGIERLGETLRGRIDAARSVSGAGLGTLALRLRGADITPVFDAYVRRDGETVPFEGEAAESLAARDADYGAATDVHEVEQVIGEVASYGAVLLRFSDPPAASAWLQEASARLATNWLHDQSARVGMEPWAAPDPQPVLATTPIGEETVALTYERPVGETEARVGSMVFARLGRDIAWVRLDAPSGASLAAVWELAEAQASCLGAGSCRDGAPAPAALTSPPVSPPPVATSASVGSPTG